MTRAIACFAGLALPGCYVPWGCDCADLEPIPVEHGPCTASLLDEESSEGVWEVIDGLPTLFWVDGAGVSWSVVFEVVDG